MTRIFLKLFLGFFAGQVFFAAEVLCETAKTLPKSFKLTGLKNEAIDSSDLKDKVVVMQFWASWCKSCSTTMKTLDKATQGQSEVKFVTVSVDENIKSARGYFKNLPKHLQRLESKAYFDSAAKLATGLEIESLPSFIVVDDAGKILGTFEGHPDKKDLAKLKKLLAEGRS